MAKADYCSEDGCVHPSATAGLQFRAANRFRIKCFEPQADKMPLPAVLDFPRFCELHDAFESVGVDDEQRVSFIDLVSTSATFFGKTLSESEFRRFDRSGRGSISLIDLVAGLYPHANLSVIRRWASSLKPRTPSASPSPFSPATLAAASLSERAQRPTSASPGTTLAPSLSPPRPASAFGYVSSPKRAPKVDPNLALAALRTALSPAAVDDAVRLQASHEAVPVSLPTPVGRPAGLSKVAADAPSFSAPGEGPSCDAASGGEVGGLGAEEEEGTMVWCACADCDATGTAARAAVAASHTTKEGGDRGGGTEGGGDVGVVVRVAIERGCAAWLTAAVAAGAAVVDVTADSTRTVGDLMSIRRVHPVTVHEVMACGAEGGATPQRKRKSGDEDRVPHGLPPNVAEIEVGSKATALHVAAAHPAFDTLLRVLLGLGCDATAQTKTGVTPLMIAAAAPAVPQGHTGPDVASARPQTARDATARRAGPSTRTPAVGSWSRVSSSWNFPTKDPLRVRRAKAEGGERDWVRWGGEDDHENPTFYTLLHAGTPLDAKDSSKRAAVWYAAACGHLAAVAALIRNGATTVPMEGEPSPQAVAHAGSHSRVVALLEADRRRVRQLNGCTEKDQWGDTAACGSPQKGTVGPGGRFFRHASPAAAMRLRAVTAAGGRGVPFSSPSSTAAQLLDRADVPIGVNAKVTEERGGKTMTWQRRKRETPVVKERTETQPAPPPASVVVPVPDDVIIVAPKECVVLATACDANMAPLGRSLTSSQDIGAVGSCVDGGCARGVLSSSAALPLVKVSAKGLVVPPRGDRGPEERKAEPTALAALLASAFTMPERPVSPHAVVYNMFLPHPSVEAKPSATSAPASASALNRTQKSMKALWALGNSARHQSWLAIRPSELPHTCRSVILSFYVPPGVGDKARGNAVIASASTQLGPLYSSHRSSSAEESEFRLAPRMCGGTTKHVECVASHRVFRLQGRKPEPDTHPISDCGLTRVGVLRRQRASDVVDGGVGGRGWVLDLRPPDVVMVPAKEIAVSPAVVANSLWTLPLPAPTEAPTPSSKKGRVPADAVVVGSFRVACSKDVRSLTPRLAVRSLLPHPLAVPCAPPLAMLRWDRDVVDGSQKADALVGARAQQRAIEKVVQWGMKVSGSKKAAAAVRARSVPAPCVARLQPPVERCVVPLPDGMCATATAPAGCAVFALPLDHYGTPAGPMVRSSAQLGLAMDAANGHVQGGWPDPCAASERPVPLGPGFASLPRGMGRAGALHIDPSLLPATTDSVLIGVWCAAVLPDSAWQCDALAAAQLVVEESRMASVASNPITASQSSLYVEAYDPQLPAPPTPSSTIKPSTKDLSPPSLSADHATPRSPVHQIEQSVGRLSSPTVARPGSPLTRPQDDALEALEVGVPLVNVNDTVASTVLNPLSVSDASAPGCVADVPAATPTVILTIESDDAAAAAAVGIVCIDTAGRAVAGYVLRPGASVAARGALRLLSSGGVALPSTDCEVSGCDCSLSSSSARTVLVAEVSLLHLPIECCAVAVVVANPSPVGEDVAPSSPRTFGTGGSQRVPAAFTGRVSAFASPRATLQYPSKPKPGEGGGFSASAGPGHQLYNVQPLLAACMAAPSAAVLGTIVRGTAERWSVSLSPLTLSLTPRCPPQQMPHLPPGLREGPPITSPAQRFEAAVESLQSAVRKLPRAAVATLPARVRGTCRRGDLGKDEEGGKAANDARAGAVSRRRSNASDIAAGRAIFWCALSRRHDSKRSPAGDGTSATAPQWAVVLPPRAGVACPSEKNPALSDTMRAFVRWGQRALSYSALPVPVAYHVRVAPPPTGPIALRAPSFEVVAPPCSVVVVTPVDSSGALGSVTTSVSGLAGGGDVDVPAGVKALAPTGCGGSALRFALDELPSTWDEVRVGLFTPDLGGPLVGTPNVLGGGRPLATALAAAASCGFDPRELVGVAAAARGPSGHMTEVAAQSEAKASATRRGAATANLYAHVEGAVHVACRLPPVKAGVYEVGAVAVAPDGTAVTGGVLRDGSPWALGGAFRATRGPVCAVCESANGALVGLQQRVFAAVTAVADGAAGRGRTAAAATVDPCVSGCRRCARVRARGGLRGLELDLSKVPAAVWAVVVVVAGVGAPSVSASAPESVSSVPAPDGATTPALVHTTAVLPLPICDPGPLRSGTREAHEVDWGLYGALASHTGPLPSTGAAMAVATFLRVDDTRWCVSTSPLPLVMGAFDPTGVHGAPTAIDAAARAMAWTSPTLPLPPLALVPPTLAVRGEVVPLVSLRRGAPPRSPAGSSSPRTQHPPTWTAFLSPAVAHPADLPSWSAALPPHSLASVARALLRSPPTVEPAKSVQPAQQSEAPSRKQRRRANSRASNDGAAGSRRSSVRATSPAVRARGVAAEASSDRLSLNASADAPKTPTAPPSKSAPPPRRLYPISFSEFGRTYLAVLRGDELNKHATWRAAYNVGVDVERAVVAVKDVSEYAALLESSAIEPSDDVIRDLTQGLLVDSDAAVSPEAPLRALLTRLMPHVRKQVDHIARLRRTATGSGRRGSFSVLPAGDINAPADALHMCDSAMAHAAAYVTTPPASGMAAVASAFVDASVRDSISEALRRSALLPSPLWGAVGEEDTSSGGRGGDQSEEVPASPAVVPAAGATRGLGVDGVNWEVVAGHALTALRAAPAGGTVWQCGVVTGPDEIAALRDAVVHHTALHPYYTSFDIAAQAARQLKQRYGAQHVAAVVWEVHVASGVLSAEDVLGVEAAGSAVGMCFVEPPVVLKVDSVIAAGHEMLGSICVEALDHDVGLVTATQVRGVERGRRLPLLAAHCKWRLLKQTAEWGRVPYDTCATASPAADESGEDEGDGAPIRLKVWLAALPDRFPARYSRAHIDSLLESYNAPPAVPIRALAEKCGIGFDPMLALYVVMKDAPNGDASRGGIEGSPAVSPTVGGSSSFAAAQEDTATRVSGCILTDVQASLAGADGADSPTFWQPLILNLDRAIASLVSWGGVDCGTDMGRRASLWCAVAGRSSQTVGSYFCAGDAEYTFASDQRAVVEHLVASANTGGAHTLIELRRLPAKGVGSAPRVAPFSTNALSGEYLLRRGGELLVVGRAELPDGSVKLTVAPPAVSDRALDACRVRLRATEAAKEAAQHDAATRIQSLQRARLARQRTAALRQQRHEAATRIQALMRGRTTRRALRKNAAAAAADRSFDDVSTSETEHDAKPARLLRELLAPPPAADLRRCVNEAVKTATLKGGWELESAREGAVAAAGGRWVLPPSSVAVSVPTGTDAAPSPPQAVWVVAPPGVAVVVVAVDPQHSVTTLPLTAPPSKMGNGVEDLRSILTGLRSFSLAPTSDDSNIHPSPYTALALCAAELPPHVAAVTLLAHAEASVLENGRKVSIVLGPVPSRTGASMSISGDLPLLADSAAQIVIDACASDETDGAPRTVDVNVVRQFSPLPFETSRYVKGDVKGYHVGLTALAVVRLLRTGADRVQLVLPPPQWISFCAPHVHLDKEGDDSEKALAPPVSRSATAPVGAHTVPSVPWIARALRWLASAVGPPEGFGTLGTPLVRSVAAAAESSLAVADAAAAEVLVGNGSAKSEKLMRAARRAQHAAACVGASAVPRELSGAPLSAAILAVPPKCLDEKRTVVVTAPRGADAVIVGLDSAGQAVGAVVSASLQPHVAYHPSYTVGAAVSTAYLRCADDSAYRAASVTVPKAVLPLPPGVTLLPKASAEGGHAVALDLGRLPPSWAAVALGVTSGVNSATGHGHVATAATESLPPAPGPLMLGVGPGCAPPLRHPVPAGVRAVAVSVDVEPSIAAGVSLGAVAVEADGSVFAGGTLWPESPWALGGGLQSHTIAPPPQMGDVRPTVTPAARAAAAESLAAELLGVASLPKDAGAHRPLDASPCVLAMLPSLPRRVVAVHVLLCRSARGGSGSSSGPISSTATVSVRPVVELGCPPDAVAQQTSHDVDVSAPDAARAPAETARANLHQAIADEIAAAFGVRELEATAEDVWGAVHTESATSPPHRSQQQRKFRRHTHLAHDDVSSDSESEKDTQVLDGRPLYAAQTSLPSSGSCRCVVTLMRAASGWVIADEQFGIATASVDAYAAACGYGNVPAPLLPLSIVKGAHLQPSSVTPIGLLQRTRGVLWALSLQTAPAVPVLSDDRDADRSFSRVAVPAPSYFASLAAALVDFGRTQMVSHWVPAMTLPQFPGAAASAAARAEALSVSVQRDHAQYPATRRTAERSASHLQRVLGLGQMQKRMKPREGRYSLS